MLIQCAAGCARPGIAIAISQLSSFNKVKWFTVFAGVDRDATARARFYTPEIAPSSPSIFLFKDGKMVADISRHQIEGQLPEHVASDLVQKVKQYFQ